MSEKTIQQLSALSLHLASRRPAILAAWRESADADPAQTTVNFLTRTQFNDHIPQLLDAFERKLSARPGGGKAAAADQDKAVEDVKHGLQRWQQGYRLGELVHEWGHLHLCLFEEIETFGAARPEIEPATLAAAHRELIQLINGGVNESANQYARMQQAEAAGHLHDLQQTLTRVQELERRRADQIREAVHDLRGNVQSVSTAAEVLGSEDVTGPERVKFATLLQQGIGAVDSMVTQLVELARLEAGQERREVAAFDVAQLLGELCATTQPVADERSLYLKSAGPPELKVEGDAGKVRRLVQNLLFNALKYTEQGGVTVSWGEAKGSWWVSVKDTGPGILAGPGSPVATDLAAATDSAREAEQAAHPAGEKSTVLPKPAGGSAPAERVHQQRGEGIGLSIVKRLCELLDGSLELASSADSGTTFRAVFPLSYRLPQKK